MNRSLEALERIKKLYIQAVKQTKYSKFTDLEKDKFEIIETALKRLEQIETNQTIFENNPITVGKKIMALEIIKTKRVDVFWLMECISCYTNALERYNEDVLDKDIDCLTQEEFDLLKEVLK